MNWWMGQADDIMQPTQVAVVDFLFKSDESNSINLFHTSDDALPVSADGQQQRVSPLPAVQCSRPGSRRPKGRHSRRFKSRAHDFGAYQDCLQECAKGMERWVRPPIVRNMPCWRVANAPGISATPCRAGLGETLIPLGDR